MVRGEPIDFSLPENLNLGSYFLDGNLCEARHDKIAIYYKDRTLTFRELWALTNRIGNILKEIGTEPENRVLLVLQDSPEWAASWLATMKIGAVGTHAYTYLKPDDYEYLLNLVRPKVVVTDETTIEVLRAASSTSKYPQSFLVAGSHTVPLGEGEYRLTEMLDCASDELEPEPTHRDDVAFWNFSGGTTGKPKGVPHMHRDGAIAYESFQHVLGYKESDIVLRVPKLFFHYSRDLGLLFPLRAGASVVLFPERTTAEVIFKLICKHKPTVLINVPTMMRAMIQTPEPERSDLSSLRRCMSSGELLSAQLYDQWVKTFGMEVVNRFGSAESCMGYLCNRPGAVVPGSSGTATPMTELKIVDQEGKEVVQGQSGVLMVRCDAAALCYVRDHEKSKRTFMGDEWINTGDLFYQDDQDYFWYLGRADEMVKISGVWVSPLEIERCLQEHPYVKECAVLGIEDKDRLITLRAYVKLSEATDAGEKAAEELKSHCKRKLATYKYPRSIEFVDHLPKTGQGKIDRRLLRGT
jgi:benzoate-CoA ligase family protein